MKRFLSMLATGAAAGMLALGLSTSASAQVITRGFGVGALILDDNLSHTITLETPQSPFAEWSAWSGAGFPSVWIFPVPPFNNAQSGFVFSGPLTGTATPPLLSYWLPPGQTTINGGAYTGGAAGAWDYATTGELGLLSGSGTQYVIPAWDAGGSSLTNSSITDNGAVSTTEDFSAGNVTATGSLQAATGEQFSNLNSAGVVHTNGSGNLSTGLIVNGDITDATIQNGKLANPTIGLMSSDGSLSVPSPLTLGDASDDFTLNLSNPNTWEATQTFPAASITNAELVNSSINYTSTDGSVNVPGSTSLGGTTDLTVNTANVTLAGDVSGPANANVAGSFNGGTPFGDMAGQTSSAVSITGGAISGTTITTSTLDATNTIDGGALTAGTVANAALVNSSINYTSTDGSVNVPGSTSLGGTTDLTVNTANVTLAGDVSGPANANVAGSFNGGTPFGDMAGQTSSAVSITGGAISGTTITTSTLDATNTIDGGALTAGTVANAALVNSSINYTSTDGSVNVPGSTSLGGTTDLTVNTANVTLAGDVSGPANANVAGSFNGGTPFGDMAGQTSSAVSITGGTIDGTTISATNTIDGGGLTAGTVANAALVNSSINYTSTDGSVNVPGSTSLGGTTDLTVNTANVTLAGDVSGPANANVAGSFNGGTPFGDMAGQTSSAVSITGGAISGTTITTSTLDATNTIDGGALTAGTVANAALVNSSINYTSTDGSVNVPGSTSLGGTTDLTVNTANVTLAGDVSGPANANVAGSFNGGTPFGDMAGQTSSAVSITGGTIDGTTISATNTIDGGGLTAGTVANAALVNSSINYTSTDGSVNVPGSTSLGGTTDLTVNTANVTLAGDVSGPANANVAGSFNGGTPFGDMAGQTSSAVSITGGTIDGTTISATNTIDGGGLTAGTVANAALVNSSINYTSTDGSVNVPGSTSLGGTTDLTVNTANVTLAGDVSGPANANVAGSFNGGTPFGDMAGQTSSAVSITGGAISGTTITTSTLDATNTIDGGALTAGTVANAALVNSSINYTSTDGSVNVPGSTSLGGTTDLTVNTANVTLAGDVSGPANANGITATAQSGNDIIAAINDAASGNDINNGNISITADNGTFNGTLGAGATTVASLDASTGGITSAGNVSGVGTMAGTFGGTFTITTENGVLTDFAVPYSNITSGTSTVVITTQKSTAGSYYTAFVASETTGTGFTVHLSAAPPAADDVIIHYIVVN